MNKVCYRSSRLGEANKRCSVLDADVYLKCWKERIQVKTIVLSAWEQLLYSANSAASPTTKNVIPGYSANSAASPTTKNVIPGDNVG